MAHKSTGRSTKFRIIYLVSLFILLFSLSAGAALLQTPGQLIVISWSDTGMHWANQDFSTMALFPPYNTLRAQVIRRGTADDGPSLVTNGITLTYEVPGNESSEGKTNFWTYAESLFGVKLMPGMGFTGKGLSGEFVLNKTKKDYFEARGIPLTPNPDFNVTTDDPYQLAKVTLYDAAGNNLAETQPVIPVSNEMGCSTCHASEVSIITNHPPVPNMDLSQPVLCARCHASNALGLKGIPRAKSLSEVIHRKHDPVTNDCESCHPGHKTRAHRGVMATKAEMICQDCHGNMANVADSIIKGRRPWLDEPDCGTCHGPRYAVEPEKSYRDSKGHGGIYCSACHGPAHAVLPSREEGDNQQNIALQGFAGTLRDCTVCHEDIPAGAGPHGAEAKMAVQ